MIEKKRVLALIPARGGSKGLPGKNVRMFAGKPLITWTIETAKDSELVDTTLVSTDASDIARIASQSGAEISIRPDRLATDTSLVADTIRYTIATLQSTGDSYDILALMQPTSPIRPKGLLEDCIRRLHTENLDSIAIFSESAESPDRLWVLDGHHPRPLLANAAPWLPRQQLQACYYLNGLLYVFDVAKFLANPTNSVLFGRSSAMLTEPFVDIDTWEDFHRAEMIFRDYARPA